MPPRVLDAMDISVQLLGDCTEEEITRYLAIGTMPEKAERDKRMAELEEEYARGREEGND